MSALTHRITRFQTIQTVTIFLALIAVYLASTCSRAWYKPFWYDEIFTLTIAGQQSIGDMWSAETAGFEYNPPLIYMLTRATGSLGAHKELFARLAPIAGYLVMIACSSLFLARRLPIAFALPGVGFALLSEAYDYSYEARPYGLVLGFAGAALVSWQLAADHSVSRLTRRLGLLVLAVALSGALLSHCYAVLLYVPICAGELWRTFSRKRIDVAVWSVVILSVAPIALYLPLLAGSRKVVLGASLFAPSGRRFLGAYALIIKRGLLPLAILFTPLVAFAWRRRRVVYHTATDLLRLVPDYELVAVAAFLLVPACGFGISKVLHSAYVPRYGLAATLGFSALIAFSVYVLGAGHRVWALWMIGGAVVWFVISFALAARQWPYQKPNGNSTQRLVLAAASTGRPVVISDGRDFLAFAYYFPPEYAKQVVFAADPVLAIKLTGSDAVDTALLLARPWLPFAARIETYRDFLSRNNSFVLYAPDLHPLEWISHQLRADGAVFRPGNGLYLYDVSVGSSASVDK